MPLPQLEGVLNFRELGGLEGAGGRIRSGQIYRSGHLATATDGDLASLTSLGISTIVDFRQAVDRSGDGGEDRVPAGARLVSLPVSDPSGRGGEIRETIMSGDPSLIEARYGNGRAHAMACEGAVAQATDPAKAPTYAAFLHHVLETGRRPLLFHCSAGKDRAGWAATLVGMAVGVSDDDLVDHYLLSNVHRPPEDRRRHFADLGIDVEVLMPFLGVHHDYLAGALAAVRDGWGTPEAYLADVLDFDTDKMDRLRGELLE
jgi:protein-tyrosine phosphatase